MLWPAEQREGTREAGAPLLRHSIGRPHPRRASSSCGDAARAAWEQVDFAHTFPTGGRPDGNFTAGARALLGALSGVMQLDAHEPPQ